MSNNVPKKLQIKAELLRHLSTAEDMMNKGEPSSVVKFISLHLDIARNEAGREVNVQFWDDWFAGKDMSQHL